MYAFVFMMLAEHNYTLIFFQFYTILFVISLFSNAILVFTITVENSKKVKLSPAKYRHCLNHKK